MRRSINLVSLIAIITLLALSSRLPPNRSASAGQGKGGEVIAKPTPKKTTTARPKTGSRSPRSNSTVDELAFWETIKNSTDPEDFNAYLKQYPKGKFVTLARNRLKTLEGASISTTPNSNLTSSNMPRMRTNEAGIELMVIPPGSFMMGSTNGGDNEKPVHQVTIEYSFYMGRFEVTQAQ